MPGSAIIDRQGADRASGNACPSWCTTRHGVHLGEEDWLHVSEPVAIADGILARLCLSVDPHTGTRDGPYVLIGSTELTVSEASALGASLIELAARG